MVGCRDDDGVWECGEGGEGGGVGGDESWELGGGKGGCHRDGVGRYLLRHPLRHLGCVGSPPVPDPVLWREQGAAVN